MIYFIILLAIILFNSIMDATAINVFGRLAQVRVLKNPNLFNKILWKWVKGDSSGNKYLVRDWLREKGFTPKLADFIAKDLLVIFLDLWHFSKACMMFCVMYLVGELTFYLVQEQINFPGYVLILFILNGIVFNFVYYKFQQL